MKRPDAEFRGKSWDQNGNPTTPDQRPCEDGRDLPPLALQGTEKLPPRVEAYLLGGNWYGAGPEIVLYDVESDMNLSFPLWDRKQLPRFVRRLAKAAALKKANPAKVAQSGGVWVSG